MSLKEKVQQYFSRGKHRKEKPLGPADRGNVKGAYLRTAAAYQVMQSERTAAISKREETHKMAPADKAFANFRW